MTTTIRNLIRTLSVAALLAAAAMSLPAGDSQAAKCQSHPTETCCKFGNTYWYANHGGEGPAFTIGNKEYYCAEDGNWIIYEEDEGDEELRPAPPLRHPVSPQFHAAPRSGGVLAQP